MFNKNNLGPFFKYNKFKLIYIFKAYDAPYKYIISAQIYCHIMLI